MIEYEKLITSIHGDYDIDVLDISLYFDNGENWLHTNLQELKKDVFANNYRLVLYYGSDDRTYVNYPPRLVLSLYKILSKLDIPIFFVVLITEDDLKKDLDDAKRILSSDINTFYNIDSDVDITHHQASDIPFKVAPSTNPIKNTSCKKLWEHLHINVNGDVLPCCSCDHNFALGNITEANALDIIQSSIGNSMRESMLNGEMIPACKPCFDTEEQGIKSGRIPLTLDELQTFKSTVPNPSPSSIDIRLSNLCNLKCRMCTGNYSSKIAKEESIRYGASYKTVSHSDIKNIPQILDLLPSVSDVYFAGGEPLLMESHYQILSELIRLKKFDVAISYNTNFTVTEFKNKSIFDYWKHFNKISIGASLDAMEEHIEYSRHGTKWSDVVDNYNKIKNTNTLFKITANINIFNAFNLIDSQVHWIHNGVLPSQHNISILTNPTHLTIQILPLKFKQKLAKNINTHIEFLSAYPSNDELISQWSEIKEFMWNNDTSYLLDEFFSINDAMDEFRNENFDEIHPEYKGLRIPKIPK